MSSTKKLSKKNSKLDNKNPTKKVKIETELIDIGKKVTNEEIEKEMLKGEEHKNHIEIQNEEKNNTENNAETGNNEK